MDDRHIIIFDGVCIFCNGVVSFIIRRDPLNMFAFSPMQSEAAQLLIKKHNASKEILNTLMLIKNDRYYLRTDAILEIARDIPGLWYLLGILRIIPRPIRDRHYALVA